MQRATGRSSSDCAERAFAAARREIPMFSIKLVRALVLVAGAVLVIPACGGADDGDDDSKNEQALCISVVDTTCEKLYECFSTRTLAELGLPPTVAGCKTQFRNERGCSAAAANDTCIGSEVFSRPNAEKCVRQMRAATCNQILSAEESTDYAPACDDMCVVE